MTLEFSDREFEIGGPVGVSRPNPLIYEEVGSSASGGVGATSDVSRMGIQCRAGLSRLIGLSVKKWVVLLDRRTIDGAGAVTATIRRESDDAVVANFQESYEAADIPEDIPRQYVFTLATAYMIQGGDILLVEFGGTGTIGMYDQNPGGFDDSNTRKARFIISTTTYATASTADMSGNISNR